MSEKPNDLKVKDETTRDEMTGCLNCILSDRCAHSTCSGAIATKRMRSNVLGRWASLANPWVPGMIPVGIR